MMTKLQTLLLACASLVLGCKTIHAGISTNPVSGATVYFVGEEARSCNPDGGECGSPATLGVEVVDLAQSPNSKYIYLTKDTVKICDDIAATQCVSKNLPFSNAVSVAVGPNNSPVVVSADGKVAQCSDNCDIRPLATGGN